VSPSAQTVDPQARPLALRILLALTAACVVFYIAWVEGLGGPALAVLAGDWVYNAALVLTAATCLARAWLYREERGAWLAFGVAIACWTGGNIGWTAFLDHAEAPPYPSFADVGYLAFFPAMYVGIALLVQRRVTRFTANVWLDGMIGATATAALATAVLGPALLGLTAGDPAAVATNLAYPLGDLLLLSFVAVAVMLTGARLRWLALGAGIAAWGIADTIYLYRVAVDTYVENTLLDALWLVGALLMASAAIVRSKPAERRANAGSIVLPAVFALVAAGLLVWDHFHQVNGVSIWLAAGTLALVVVRLVLSFRENKRLFAAVESEALTDPLTSLPNRRRLLTDLDGLLHAGAAAPPSLLAMFDLDGFKAYNDSFGHPAGDILLRRLGRALADAVSPDGTAYRLGGDEFCVLATCTPARGEAIVAAARTALTDEGKGFSISTSAGSLRVPDEADEQSRVLRIADERMYAEKGLRSSSAARQTRDVLMSIFEERAPELSEHLKGVARLAVAMAGELDFDAEARDVLARAADLHDVGKVAIPDRILHKPGPLDDSEWELLHAHTLIGERILAAAPAMLAAARLVRSSHERWDGEGYPDRLAGEAIPLGSRVIFLCDAFNAITTDRPYGEARSKEEALAELRRNAGGQFDPNLVEIFCRLVESGNVAGVPDPAPAAA
jgi:diguanylate cyclase (GGDEF)-like protein